VPTRTWAPALAPDGDVRRGAHVAELTGLLTITEGWPERMRLMARTEPLHRRPNWRDGEEMEFRWGQISW
jgi:hypothetical protein